MSSRIFQSMIVQMKEATPRTIGIVNDTGTVIATTDLSIMGLKIVNPASIMPEEDEELTMSGGKTFRVVPSGDQDFDYAVFVEGIDDVAAGFCTIVAIAAIQAKTYYEEKFDRTTLVKNIITENILPGDIYVHARELHFVSDMPRAVFFIRQFDRRDPMSLEVLRRMYPDRDRDFVISMSEKEICVVKEVPAATEEADLRRMASEMERTLMEELRVATLIGVGTLANHIRELASRYKEAQTALEVGKVFEPEQTIVCYESLGIGRLIYQLPTTMCEMFLNEVFKKSPIDALDNETLSIINEFFDNNLNISETSRKLFVHRNTLVYRLGKIKKLTGLDLREFDEAIVFKVALMVKKYLDSQRAPRRSRF